MALIVEDGSLPAGANAAVTVAEVDTFAADNTMTEGVADWAGATAPSKEAAIRQATRYLAGLHWRGAARGRLAFPRSGCSELNGPAIGDTEIPWRYQEAACLLALKALAGPLLEDTATGIHSVKAGPVDVEFEPGQSVSTEFTEAMSLLRPLLQSGTDLATAPIFGRPAPLPPDVF
ncbi:DnaT-like ssDNA-binding protein [Azospirillum sp. TSA6c]|uniref:DnaT-like ssDNA-binding protein n=1 Tax=Azospirillum sp. TSA6c TaxID=709813 RepID=UPI000D65490B|nr:DnaT-like ssDNA-binding protein [Azospirillum sp. TSA6c]